MPRWLYLATCVLVPPAWGWLMVHAVDAWERRRAARAPALPERADDAPAADPRDDETLPPIDYVI